MATIALSDLETDLTSKNDRTEHVEVETIIILELKLRDVQRHIFALSRT
jgi:hypothetical protein